MGMWSFFFLVLSLLLYSSSPLSSSSTSQSFLSQGSSLSVEQTDDVLISPNGTFTAGFYPVGDNAYCFAIWFSSKPSSARNRTVVWMANRDKPVNGKHSKLSLLKNGNLILTDAGRLAWATDSVSASSMRLQIDDTGNLVLSTLEGNNILWQSFDFPTDTLLPNQQFTRNSKLVSSRSQTSYFSGSYQLYFHDDNVLRLVFYAPYGTSIYWPFQWQSNWRIGTTFSSVYTRIAVLNSSGFFTSSDGWTFLSADFGRKIHRRLTLDPDGNFRLYSREEGGEENWVVQWQAIQRPCRIHGICGPNSLCGYDPSSGGECSCLPGYKVVNSTDKSYGCEPQFNITCNDTESADFLRFPHADFYGFDVGLFMNKTWEECKDLCLESCCIGFQYADEGEGIYRCYPKTSLKNGYSYPSFRGSLYLKYPKSMLSSYKKNGENFRLYCSGEIFKLLDRTYVMKGENRFLKFMLWSACGVGAVEMICIFLAWCFLVRDVKDPSADMQGYLLAATGFKKFTYAELKMATRGFSERIGRGGGGVVYKGILSDNRVAAIKRLNEANQGEAEFLAEVSTIGKLNHMNLIAMWGYCAEGKHRLLVYEYMEHGSLADNLSSNTLNWEKRFEIALGTAKGLAYLHEECLEWILHCDVKPQNILLDSNDNPKVADFGLSKLLKRTDLNNSSFSRIRGTRGYMAPEWIFNLPITSKVDVYSYGIVVLEMVTGKSAIMGVHAGEGGGEMEQRSLVMWVREKMNEAPTKASWMEEIIDKTIEGDYDNRKLEILVEVALKCIEEEKDTRPTMSQVGGILLCHENDQKQQIHLPSPSPIDSQCKLQTTPVPLLTHVGGRRKEEEESSSSL